MFQRNETDHPIHAHTEPRRVIEPGEVVFWPDPIVGMTPYDPPEGPVPTEPGCQHPDCILEHPHAGPAELAQHDAKPATADTPAPAGPEVPARPSRARRAAQEG